MLKLNGFTVLLCVIAFFQLQGTCVADDPAYTSNAPESESSSSEPDLNGTTTTTASLGETTPQPDIGDPCPGGSCKQGLICDTSCKIAAGNNCTTGSPDDNCQNGTSCINATSADTCTVKDGFVGSACTDNSNCNAANTECNSSKCQCKSGFKTNTINLQCQSGSATVMASVLVLAVAFVKTQLF